MIGAVRTETVASTSDLLLRVVEVRSGQELTKDELRHILVVLLVDLNRDAPPIIEDGNATGNSVNLNLFGDQDIILFGDQVDLDSNDLQSAADLT